MRILILARMTTAFNGESFKEKPLGGSESALFYVSRELARLGHRVVIFNHCGAGAGTYEEVEYRHFTTLLDLVDYSKKENFDIFITYRDLPALLFPIRAKKRICWISDDFSNVWNHTPPLRWLGIAFLKFAGFLTKFLLDKLFVVSNWQAQICIDYLGIPKKIIYVTRNGIHLPYFENINQKRDMNRLVYTSVPPRGLDILLEIFPKIREKIPNAKLCIYGGLNLGAINDQQREKLKQLLDQTNQPGVELVGTKTHAELAKELQQSILMLYPSHEVKDADFYAETSCIAVLEAQAAGCPVVASKRGALPESILDGKTGILIEGDPYSEEFKETFARETTKLLKDPVRYTQYSKNCKEYIRNKYSWKTIAQEWEVELKRLLNK